MATRKPKLSRAGAKAAAAAMSAQHQADAPRISPRYATLDDINEIKELILTSQRTSSTFTAPAVGDLNYGDFVVTAAVKAEHLEESPTQATITRIRAKHDHLHEQINKLEHLLVAVLEPLPISPTGTAAPSTDGCGMACGECHLHDRLLGAERETTMLSDRLYKLAERVRI